MPSPISNLTCLHTDFVCDKLTGANGVGLVEMNGWGVRGGVDFMCSPGVAGSGRVCVCCWYHESGFGFSAASLCVTLLWLRFSSSGNIPPAVTKHFLFHIPWKGCKLSADDVPVRKKIIIVRCLISQACNMFLCCLGLASSSGCALEECDLWLSAHVVL